MSRAVGRSGGKAVTAALAAALVLTARPPDRLTAQRLTLGPQVVLGDYREVARDLKFRGTGFGGVAMLAWKKFSADVAYARLDYEPTDDSNAIEKFTATQFDARARYYISGPVSLEVGVTSRETDPEFAAQSAAAIRAGVRVSYPLGADSRLNLRANYLGGAKFSGGGSSPFGIELGLGIAADVARRRVRLLADYEFQRLDRTTDDGTREEAVPVQQALVRLGVAVNAW